MCNECWKEFKGWCRAFTQTEVFLAIFEAILLIICIAFLIFLILHIIVCSNLQTQQSPDRDTYEADKPIYKESGTVAPVSHTTLDPAVKCTWEPSKKTEAPTKYYAGSKPKFVQNEKIVDKTIIVLKETRTTTPMSVQDQGLMADVGRSSEPGGDVDSLVFDEQSDGEDADSQYKSSILALVRLRPARGVSFGCAVAVVAPRWALTAASCLEAIEETDSLDNYLLMERYGSARRGRTHAIADVQIHPLYQGSNRSYDVALLRSEDSLRPATPLALPSLLDYFLITVGERLSLLGFGSFRTVEQPLGERSLRSVLVYVLPGAACEQAERAERAGGEGGGDGEGYSLRHLSRGRQDDHASAGGCGAGPLCAGVRYARGAPCTYCAGSPLVSRGRLVGVLTSPRACAVSCEPARLANLAAPPLAAWITSLTNVTAPRAA